MSNKTCELIQATGPINFQTLQKQAAYIVETICLSERIPRIMIKYYPRQQTWKALLKFGEYQVRRDVRGTDFRQLDQGILYKKGYLTDYNNYRTIALINRLLKHYFRNQKKIRNLILKIRSSCLNINIKNEFKIEHNSWIEMKKLKLR